MVEAGIGGHARAEAAERGPEARLARGQVRSRIQPPSSLRRAARTRSSEEARSRRSPSASSFQPLGFLSRAEEGARRIEHVADRDLGGLVEPAREPAPGDPELLPAPHLLRKEDALGEERGEARGPLFVARRAEAGPPAVAGEEPEDALVIGGSTATLGLGRERVEELARDRSSTRRARRGGARARARDPSPRAGRRRGGLCRRRAECARAPRRCGARAEEARIARAEAPRSRARGAGRRGESGAGALRFQRSRRRRDRGCRWR